MMYLIFTGGVIFGAIVSNFYHHLKTGYGHFKVEPYVDEDGSLDDYYRVNVALSPGQKLLNVKKIILYKDNSQK